MNNKNNGPRPLTLNATDKYEIEVRPVLQKWSVVVYELPARKVVTEDSYPSREQAVGRAHDFRAIIINKDAVIEHENALKHAHETI